MTNKERLALISHAQEWIKETEQCRDEIPFGLSDESEMELKLIKIALASLQAEPACYAHRLVNTLSGTIYPWSYGLEERKQGECSGFTVEVKPLYSSLPAPATPTPGGDAS